MINRIMFRMEAKLKTLSAQELDIESKMETVKELIAQKNKKWFAGRSSSLFKTTRRTL